jgi:hypothetical protein
VIGWEKAALAALASLLSAWDVSRHASRIPQVWSDCQSLIDSLASLGDRNPHAVHEHLLAAAAYVALLQARQLAHRGTQQRSLHGRWAVSQRSLLDMAALVLAELPSCCPPGSLQHTLLFAGCALNLPDVSTWRDLPDRLAAHLAVALVAATELKEAVDPAQPLLRRPHWHHPKRRQRWLSDKRDSRMVNSHDEFKPAQAARLLLQSVDLQLLAAERLNGPVRVCVLPHPALSASERLAIIDALQRLRNPPR